MKHSINKHILVAIMMIFTSMSLGVNAASNSGRNNLGVVKNKLAMLESSVSGQLGVYALNTATNERIDYHSNERFPLCSTNKVMGVAAILKKGETKPKLLHKKIKYKKSDLIVWSPATEKHINSGMTITELAKASITLSDNTAINLIMQQIGGPKGVTAFARSIGDETFKLVRWEPELNTAIPGDVRDTSTPEAMGSSLRKLVLSNALAPTQRNLLTTWLIENTTGDSRIRAGVPKAWIVGDKTGTCRHGTTNDVAVIWPKGGAPIIVAIYFTQQKESAPARDDVIAKTTRIILNAMFKAA